MPTDVATRTAMKALSPTTATSAYLSENGREGIFDWDPTIVPAVHQIDGLEGVYVAPNATANGAWVHIVPEAIYDVRWWGAVDDCPDCAGLDPVSCNPRSGTSSRRPPTT